MSTIMGKIKKFFADLTAPAFAQMITTKDDLLATKKTGYVPDAKAVADAVTDVTSKLGVLQSLGLGADGTSTNDCLYLNNKQNGSINFIGGVIEDNNIINSPISTGTVVFYKWQLNIPGTHAIVFLFEIHPVPSRIWMNTYNGASGWQGWRSIALQ